MNASVQGQMIPVDVDGQPSGRLMAISPFTSRFGSAPARGPAATTVGTLTTALGGG